MSLVKGKMDFMVTIGSVIVWLTAAQVTVTLDGSLTVKNIQR